MKHPITGLDHSPMVCPHHHVSSSASNEQCMQCDKQRLNTSGIAPRTVMNCLVSRDSLLVSIPGQHSKTNTMIRVSNFFQVDAITIRKEDLKSQEFSLSVIVCGTEVVRTMFVFHRFHRRLFRLSTNYTLNCSVSPN